MRHRLYNPSQLNRDELHSSFIVRRKILLELLRFVEAQPPDIPPQHILLIGNRGMGKTTLGLTLLLHIDESPQLSELWQPVAFFEESYGVNDLGDLWTTALHHLSDAVDDNRWLKIADRLERNESDEKLLAAKALSTLKDFCNESGKRLILFIENLDTIFHQFKDNGELHSLRAVLMTAPEIMLIGTANSVFGQIHRHGEPLYEFFRLIHLDGLNSDETRKLLYALAEARRDTVVPRVLSNDPGRVEILRQFCGGNPRLLVLTYRLLSESPVGTAREDLECLIDEQTPYFKARIEEIPPQARRVFHTLADNWAPMMSREVGQSCRLSSSQASAQLKQLVENGFVREVWLPQAKKVRYELSERFYNIYYIFRFSRNNRKRLERLIQFLRDLYGPRNIPELYKAAIEVLKSESDVGEDGPLLLGVLLDRAGDDIRGEEVIEWIRQAMGVSLERGMRQEASKALERLTQDHMAGAISVGEYQADLEDYLKAFPNDVVANTNLGFLLIEQQEYDRARHDVFEPLASRSPGHPAINLAIAICYLGSEDVQAAAQVMDKVSDYNPPTAGLALMVASVFEATDRIERSNYYIDKAMEMEPGDIESIRLIADALHKAERFEDELAYLSNEAKKDDSTAEINFLLGRIINWTTVSEEGLARLKKAVELDNNNEEYWFFLANDYFVAEEFDSAKSAANRLLEINPSLALGWGMQSDILVGLGEWRAALEAIDKAFALGLLSQGVTYNITSVLTYLLAASKEHEVFDLIERHQATEILEPIYHASNRQRGENLPPLPAEVLEAVSAVEDAVEELRQEGVCSSASPTNQSAD